MLCGKVNYKKLEIYHLAHDFVLHIYKICSTFPEHESKNLVSQLRRAATSLPLNIAEGSGSISFRSFLNYLVFCYRSALETEAALRLSKDLNYINNQQYEETFEKLDKLIRKLYKYMQYIENKADKSKQRSTPFYNQNKEEIKSDVARR